MTVPLHSGAELYVERWSRASGRSLSAGFGGALVPGSRCRVVEEELSPRMQRGDGLDGAMRWEGVPPAAGLVADAKKAKETLEGFG